MLDLAKFESGTFKFHNDYFDLVEIIEQAFETIKYQAQKKEISMDYSILDHRNEPQKIRFLNSCESVSNKNSQSSIQSKKATLGL